FTQKQIDGITEIQVKLMQESYTAMIKSSPNVGVGAAKWCDEFLPANKSLRTGELTKRFLTKNAIVNKTALKLAHAAVSDLVERHASDSNAAQCELVNLLFRCVGGSAASEIDPKVFVLDDIGDDDWVAMITNVVADMQ
ncbi:hypothetical protein TeGR_g8430, partial [Tetraparma gracilis]